MGAAIVDLLPLIAGAAIVPVPLIILLFLLDNKGGLAKAAAFTGGMILVRLAQGVLFGYIIERNAENADGGSAAAATLLLVIGLLMLIAAYKKWTKEADPDAPPPKWMAAIGALTPIKAFGTGALLISLSAKQWVFTLGALAVIAEHALGASADVVLYLFFVLAAASLMLIAVGASAIAPAHAARTLNTVRVWIERNDRIITVAVSLIFGVFFLSKGIAGLIG